MADPYLIPTEALEVGSRVYLKHPGKADEAEFMENLKQSRNFLYPWIINRTDVSFFDAYLMRFELKDIGHFICSTEDGAIVGVININEIEQEPVLKGSLGFYVFIQYARQGLMREGMELLLERAFCKLGFSSLEANIHPENEASKNFIQLLGFSQESFLPKFIRVAGRWVKHERWNLSKEDWFLKFGENSNEENTD